MLLPSQVFNTPDLLRLFLLQSDYDTVINLCRTNVLASQICKTNTFWLDKITQDFGLTPSQVSDLSPETYFGETIAQINKLSPDQINAFSPYQAYLMLFTKKGGVAIGSEQYIYWSDFMRRAIRQNKSDLVQYALDHGFNDLDVQLEEYAAKNDRGMVNYLIQLIPNHESEAASQNYLAATKGAIRGHHVDLFNYLFRITPQPIHTKKYFWSTLANTALESGYKDLFDKIKKLGESISGPRIDWGWGGILHSAIFSRNKSLVDYVLSLIPQNAFLNYDEELYDELIYAYKWQNPEVFKFILTLRPPSTGWDWNRVLKLAQYSYDPELIRYVTELAHS